MSFVIKFDGWGRSGIRGTGNFFTIAFRGAIGSHRNAARKSVIPGGVSGSSRLAGGVLLLIYALYRRDPVFIAGQALGLVVYVSQSVLHYRERTAGICGGLSVAPVSQGSAS